MFLQWVRGRQQGSYSKMALLPSFISQLINCDAYILKFPAKCSVMKHKDPVAEGYKHIRMNITLWKSGNDRMYFLGPMKRWWRIEIFRPDLYYHGLEPIKEPMVMLSFGIRLTESAKTI